MKKSLDTLIEITENRFKFKKDQDLKWIPLNIALSHLSADYKLDSAAIIEQEQLLEGNPMLSVKLHENKIFRDKGHHAEYELATGAPYDFYLVSDKGLTFLEGLMTVHTVIKLINN